MSIYRLAQEFVALPVVPPSDWLKAQKLIEDGIMKLTFLSNKTSYVLPSSHLLRFLPTTFIAPAEKKEYIKVSRLSSLLEPKH